MAPSEGGGGSGGLGGSGRRRTTAVGHGWPRLANVSHAQLLLATVAGGSHFLSSSLLVWRRHGGGVKGLVGACCWCRGGAFGCVGALPVEVLRR
jgi:hypothetical protein